MVLYVGPLIHVTIVRQGYQDQSYLLGRPYTVEIYITHGIKQWVVLILWNYT